MTPTRPSDPAVNEAADRLRSILRNTATPITTYDLLDAALATERRNTVEKIRDELDGLDLMDCSAVSFGDFARILDEVAS